MKSMQQIFDDMMKYFSEVNAEGIDGAAYCDISYVTNTDDDGFGNSLYVVFFKGEERVQSWHVSMTTGERSDLT